MELFRAWHHDIGSSPFECCGLRGGASVDQAYCSSASRLRFGGWSLEVGSLALSTGCSAAFLLWPLFSGICAYCLFCGKGPDRLAFGPRGHGWDLGADETSLFYWYCIYCSWRSMLFTLTHLTVLLILWLTGICKKKKNLAFPPPLQTRTQSL